VWHGSNGDCHRKHQEYDDVFGQSSRLVETGVLVERNFPEDMDFQVGEKFVVAGMIVVETVARGGLKV
jgi:hypothetical protein